jgi:hypothetical protein
MYNAANADGGNAGDAGADQSTGNPNDEVTDVDFEEVKDK